MYKNFKTRGEKILSLLPNKDLGSDEDTEESDVEEDIFINTNIYDDEGDFDESVFELIDQEDIFSSLNNEIEPQPSSSLEPPLITTNEIEKGLPKSPNKRPQVQKRKLPLKKRPYKKMKQHERWKWTDERFQAEVEIPKDEFSQSQKLNPFEYFKLLFSEEVMELIIFETNLYGMQKTGKPLNINTSDIADFLAIELIMGIVKMPAFTDYWALSTRYDKIANIMPLKRYEYIRKYLHFADNNLVSEDRYIKIRNFLEILRKNFMSVPNEKRQSIDEMMIPYKGKKAGQRRQYVKSKPKKWGYKVFVRAGVSGFVYDFLFYDAAETFRNIQFSSYEDMFSMAPKVIIALIKSIPNPQLTAVYFDNFFTTLPLIFHLRKEYGILSLGTVRENRLGNLRMESDKTFKKKGRGFISFKTNNSKKIIVVKWLDNEPVTLASSFVGVDPIVSKQRWCRRNKNKINVPCPKIVAQYNEHMGGVDLCDMLIALYRTHYKTHKWYMSIFSQFLDICVNNAWILHRRDFGSEAMPLKRFRLEIADGLLFSSRCRKPGRPRSSGSSYSPPPSRRSSPTPLPSSSSKFDNYGHLPIFGNKGRCRHCQTGQTSTFCEKCNMRLCYLPIRNCFYEFHHKPI